MQPKISLINQISERSFIEQTRRKQIIKAAIVVLAEHGFVNTTFVKIGKQAGINPSLISYHFTNKAELTDEVRRTIYQERYIHVSKATEGTPSWTEKLQAYIQADMKYMSSQPKLFRALVEVLFGQRDSKGQPTYMKDTDAPMLLLLQTILQSGQESGEFKNFNAYALAHIIDGAKDQFLAQLSFRPSLEVALFTDTLLQTVTNATKERL